MFGPGVAQRPHDKYENGLNLGRAHVAQGPHIKNLPHAFLAHILKIKCMKFDGSRSNGLGGDRF